MAFPLGLYVDQGVEIRTIFEKAESPASLEA